MVSSLDPNSVKIYTVNGAPAGSSSSLPDWLTRKRAVKAKGKRAVREHVEGSIELIQHFEFPEASNKVKTTRDGKHVIATGTYKPQMRVWDLGQLSLKFERHSDAENVDFEILSDDWTKTLHLQSDRTLELHTQGGLHYKTRIPRFGRALAYHYPSCDALLGASGNEVYRLNLEQGRFLNPIVLGGGGGAGDGGDVQGVNAIDVNSVHGLWAFGVDGNGTVEFWDPRSRSGVGILYLPRSRLVNSSTLSSSLLPGVDDTSAAGMGVSVTALASRSDGLSYAVGTSSGHTLLYDVRSPRAYAVKDQGYGLPVRKVGWVEGGSRMAGEGLVISADRKVVKIWDKGSPSTNFTSLTPANDLNDLHHVPGSGLLLTANEGIQMTTYYIPQLGPAPRWCAFLENLTEEMEEGAGGTKGVYEDYKFVSRAELSQLGLDHLVGTAALKPYMHGHFISLKLYDAARVIANPYVYEEQREKAIKAKMEKLAEGRIRAPKNQKKKGGEKEVVDVKVNRALAEKIRKEKEKKEKDAERKKRRKGDKTDGEGEQEEEEDDLLNDPRFSAVFQDPEYQVDERSREFALLNPSTVAQKDNKRVARRGKEDGESDSSEDGTGKGWGRGKTAVEEEEEESEKGSSDEEGESDSASEDSSEAGDLVPAQNRPQARPQAAKPSVRMVPLRTQGSSSRAQSSADAAFGQRRQSSKGKYAAKSRDQEQVVHKADGGVEMSWVPSSRASKSGGGDDDWNMDEGPGKHIGKAAVQRREDKKRGIERFGAGMEKGGGEAGDGGADKGRGGRTERRRDVRSGSKNTFRRM